MLSLPRRALSGPTSLSLSDDAHIRTDRGLCLSQFDCFPLKEKIFLRSLSETLSVRR